jgi:hypothetical protein
MRERWILPTLFLGLLGCGSPDRSAEVDQLKAELAEAKKFAEVNPVKPVEPASGKVVTGTVRIGKLPIQDGKVVLMGETGLGYSGSIDSAGKYRILNVPPGKYTLSIHTYRTEPRIGLPAQFSDAFGSRIEFTVEPTKVETIFDATLPAPDLD